jgi:hypothetical protein
MERKVLRSSVMQSRLATSDSVTVAFEKSARAYVRPTSLHAINKSSNRQQPDVYNAKRRMSYKYNARGSSSFEDVNCHGKRRARALCRRLSVGDAEAEAWQRTTRAYRKLASSGIIQWSAAEPLARDNDDVILVCARLSDVRAVSQETKFTLENRLKSIRQVPAATGKRRHCIVVGNKVLLECRPVRDDWFRI